MINKVINTSIITLSKNDNKKFNRTLKSINSQKLIFNVEWIIIDGSDISIQEKNIKIISKYFASKLKKMFI